MPSQAQFTLRLKMKKKKKNEFNMPHQEFAEYNERMQNNIFLLQMRSRPNHDFSYKSKYG
jgi:hypothetical protein